MTAPKPCQCWIKVNLHSGHCCFAYPDPDETVYQPGVRLPCGHEDPAGITTEEGN